MKTATHLRDLGNGRHLFRLSEPVPGDWDDEGEYTFVATASATVDGALETILVGSDEAGVLKFEAHLAMASGDGPTAIADCLDIHGYTVVSLPPDRG